MPANLKIHYRNDPFHFPTDAAGKLLPGGPWLRVGVDKAEKAMCFADHAGTTAIACAASECKPDEVAVFLSRSTDWNSELLRLHGFEQKPLHIPFLDGSPPRNLHENQFLWEKHIAGKFQDGGAINHLGGVKVTGYPFRAKPDGEPVMIPQLSDSRLLNTYNDSRGILTYVDQHGMQYIMPSNAEKCATLRTHGFLKNPAMEVPFSKGEIPISTEADRAAVDNLFALQLNPTALPPALPALVTKLQNQHVYRTTGTPAAQSAPGALIS